MSNYSSISRRWLATGIGIALGLAFLAIAFRSIELHDVADIMLRRSDLRLAIPFLAGYALFFWVKALRWRIMLSNLTKAPTASLIPIIVIGYAGNIIMPMQLGEVLRIYLASQRFQLRITPTVATIFLERVFDVLVVLFVLTVALMTTSREHHPTLKAASYLLAAILAIAISVGLIYIYRTSLILRAVRFLTQLLSASHQQKILTALEGGVAGMQSLRSMRVFLAVTLASFIMWSLMAACTYLAIRAVNLEIPFSAAMITLALTIAALTLPTSPGFVGTIQLSFVLALTPLGVSATSAVAASIYYHVLITIPPLIVAGYFLLTRKYRVSSAIATARSSSTD